MKIKCEDKQIDKPKTDPMPAKYKNIYNSSQALFYAKKYAKKENEKAYRNLDKSSIIIRTVARKYTQ
jgi:hypothetical protein